MKSLSSGGTTRRIALRHDDVAHRLRADEAERVGAGELGRVDRLDAGADHLGDVGAVGEHQRHQSPEEQRVWCTPWRPQGRHPEAQHEHQQDGRDAAEQVGVDDRDDPQRQHHRRAGRLPHDGDQQRQGQDQHLADQEELDVVGPEGVPDRRERRLGVGPGEEGRLDAWASPGEVTMPSTRPPRTTTVRDASRPASDRRRRERRTASPLPLTGARLPGLGLAHDRVTAGRARSRSG